MQLPWPRRPARKWVSAGLCKADAQGLTTLRLLSRHAEIGRRRPVQSRDAAPCNLAPALAPLGARREVGTGQGQSRALQPCTCAGREQERTRHGAQVLRAKNLCTYTAELRCCESGRTSTFGSPDARRQTSQTVCKPPASCGKRIGGSGCRKRPLEGKHWHALDITRIQCSSTGG